MCNNRPTELSQDKKEHSNMKVNCHVFIYWLNITSWCLHCPFYVTHTLISAYTPGQGIPSLDVLDSVNQICY